VTDVLRASDQLRTMTSPLDAEAFTSSVVGTWWQQPAADAFGPALVSRAHLEADPAAAALLHGLAAIADPPLAAAARDALDDLAARGFAPPAWADSIGRARLGDSFTMDDELGDSTQVIMSYAYGDEEPHALVVLVDHNLGGIAKDVWVAASAAELLDQARTTAANDAELLFANAEPGRLRAALVDAFAATDQNVQPPVSDTFRQLRALATARVRALPDDGTTVEPPAWSDEQREELVAAFVASPEAQGLSDEAATAVAVELVGYGCDHDRGQPLRVSPTKLEVFLLGWLPTTGLLDRVHVDDTPAVLSAWVRFAASRTHLSASAVEETLEAVATLGPQFGEAYFDKERWGPARTAVEAMLADIDPAQEDADVVFTRRMFALPAVPGPEFDPADAGAFLRVAEEEYPEYAPLLAAAGADADPADGPVVAGVNVRLRVAMHAAVARQLWFDDPPEVWATAQRLLDAEYDRRDVLHALTHVLSAQERDGSTGAPTDPQAYREALDTLPESWEKTRPDPEGGGPAATP